MTYSEKLKDPRWQRKRLECFESNDFKCQLCGDRDSTLHAHHLCYSKSYNPWDVRDYDLLCLCKDCHAVRHLKDLTEKESKIESFIFDTAIICNGENQLINILVKELNSILLDIPVVLKKMVNIPEIK